MRSPAPAALPCRALPALLLVGACGVGACDGGSGRSPATASTAAGVADVFDEARARGLDYVNRSGGPEKRTILEANGAGVALVDLGTDGDLDIVFAQGLESLERAVAGPGADLAVFVNDGRGHFARAAGPGLSGWWTGLATGDVDGDGDVDLVAAGFGGLAVLLQDARGVLVPRKEALPLPSDPGARLEPGSTRERGHAPFWATSVALFDADRDGALDLYVCQYVDLDPLAPPLRALGEGALAVPCRWKEQPVYCGPAGLPAQPDRLLVGRGDGTFQDESATRLVDQHAGYALAVLPFDADQDGDTDLFVANDSTPNLLWINDGHGVFRDHAYEAGVAYSADGRAQAGMGAASGDVNRDGLPDFAVANFSDEPTELFLGRARGFGRATYTSGLARVTRRLLSWSVHLTDLDGDGWLELVQTNGHVYPEADAPNTGTRYGQPVTAWSLGPELAARPIAAVLPESLFAPELGSRGAALGDVDGDGRPDLVVARIDGPCALGMNRLGRGNHRLSVRCLGPRARKAAAPRTPADGTGARVAVDVQEGGTEHALLREAQTAQGYQSASSPWLDFGLGASTGYASIRIAWPSGRVEELPAGPADRRLVVREGEGVVESTEFAR
ncbi:MAG: CRTAC1 family protein [Planctomycetes bacterium]|nr:CRTAC1 family protein [Planctomycetota bacterium]